MEIGSGPAAIVPAAIVPMNVKPPAVALMVYIDTLPADPGVSLAVATYANLPVGAIATEIGFDPAAKGEPLMGVRTPVTPFIVYAETLSEPAFVT